MEKKKRMRNGLFAGIWGAVLAILLIAVIVANYFALSYSSIISSYFGHETFRVVQPEGSEPEDSEYFSREFLSSEDMMAASIELAEQIEAEGMVLLQNENAALPLGDGQRVSLFSESSVDLIYGGTGSGAIDTSTTANLKEAFESVGYTVNPVLWDFYIGNHEQYSRVIPSNLPGVDHTYHVNECPVSEYTQSVQDSFAEYADAAVVVISRSGGEGLDLITDSSAPAGNYLALTQEELDMLDMLQSSNEFDKIILLMNTSNPLEMGFLQDYPKIQACLWVGNLGQYGIQAVVKAFTGEVNPSGRLVDTYALDAFSAPAMQNFGESNVYTNGSEVPELVGYMYGNEPGDIYVAYAEGIYVGYKYYETRYEDVVLNQGNAGNFDYAAQVAYPFGHGLSYTTFEYTNFRVSSTGDGFSVTIDVTNTGGMAGKDVVQIYMQSPYTDYDRQNGVEKAAVQLVGLDKTKLLEPGETQSVSIEIDREVMKAYDTHGAGSYIVDAGDYYFAFGRNVHDALNNILAAKGRTVADGMTANGDTAFVYRHTEERLDTETYSVADNGYAIANRFAEADLGHYEGSVEGGMTYLSRNDWVGTFPKRVVATATPQMLKEMAKTGIDEDPNAEMPATGVDNGVALISLRGVDYDSDQWNVLLDQLSAEEMYNLVRVGGYGTGAVESVAKPATTDRDGPQGISGTIGTTTGLGVRSVSYSGENVMASTWNRDLLRRVGEMVGESGLHMGVYGWYAPAMNIHRTPFSGRNFEYYSEDPFLSGALAVAEVSGAQSKGIFCYIKHFALNDQDAHRYGLSTFANEQSIRELYLYPFEKAVTEGGATAVMTAYNRIGTIWAGGHYDLLTEVLRNEWGFHGTVLTDWAAMYYMDLGLGLQAGGNQWLNTNNEFFTINGYQESPTVMSALRESAHNILYTAVNSAAMNGFAQNSRVVAVTPLWQWWLLALDTVLGLTILGGVFGIVIRCRKRRT